MTKQERVDFKERALQQAAVLQRVIVNASLRCLDVPLERVDEAIEVSLHELGRAVGADRAYCFDYDFAQGTCCNTHEWCDEDVKPQIHTMQALPLEMIEPCVAAHRRGEALVIPDTAVLAHEGFRALLFEQEVGSLFLAPMLDKGEPVGFVGFDFVRQQRTATDDELDLLSVFAKLLVNIRRRQREQAALYASERRLRTLVERFPNGGMVLYDRDLRVQTCGGAGLTRLNLTADDLLGLTVEKILPRALRERGRRLCAAVFEEREGHEMMSLRERSYECWTRPVRGPSGEVEAGVVFVIDVTEQTELQSQLTHAQKMESIGRLAGSIAHDFNNMLGVIIGHVELMLEDVEEGSELQDDLLQVQQATRRSIELTRQLLAFARKQPVSPQLLNLDDAVGAGLKMLRRLMGEDINLSWRPSGDLPPVRLDPTQLDQLLANIVVNARDAIADTGTIRIETRAIEVDADFCNTHSGFSLGRYALLTISDDGHGMSEEVKSQIFEPFFTTKTVGKGTGLGLATVYGIMRQNDGFVHVYSEIDQGTTFKLYFRAATEQQTTTTPRPRVDLEGGENVLLVEDEASLRSVSQ